MRLLQRRGTLPVVLVPTLLLLLRQVVTAVTAPARTAVVVMGGCGIHRFRVASRNRVMLLAATVVAATAPPAAAAATFAISAVAVAVVGVGCCRPTPDFSVVQGKQVAQCPGSGVGPAQVLVSCGLGRIV